MQQLQSAFGVIALLAIAWALGENRRAVSLRQAAIGLLAHQFWAELGGAPGGLPHETVAQYEEYAWPGNVRELYNAVMRRLALGDVFAAGAPSDGATAEPARDIIDRVLAQGLPLPRARQQVVEELERRYVEHVVQAHGGNVSHAAAASGIGHRYFQKLRAKLNK